MSALPKFSPSLALIAPMAAVTTFDTVEAGGYIKIGDIKGESTDARHTDWIDLSEFKWGITCEPSADGGPPDVSVQDIVIIAEANKASPVLMLSCATGKAIESAVLAIDSPGRNDGNDYLKITMEKVLVTSYQTGGSSGDVVPVDTISLNFSKITYEYHPKDGSAPVTSTHDFSDPTGGVP